jgi:hypothetical protein
LVKTIGADMEKEGERRGECRGSDVQPELSLCFVMTPQTCPRKGPREASGARSLQVVFDGVQVQLQRGMGERFKVGIHLIRDLQASWLPSFEHPRLNGVEDKEECNTMKLGLVKLHFEALV